MVCLPLIFRRLSIQLEEGRKRLCGLSLGEKLLCAGSIRRGSLCPWPVLSLEVSHTAFSRDAGESRPLVCPGGKGSGLYEHESLSATSWDSLFAFTAPELPICISLPPSEPLR